MLIRKLLGAVATAVITLSLVSCTPNSPDGAGGIVDIEIAKACEEIAQKAGSPTLQITSSKALTDTGELPPYCQIKGTIAPNIGFEARLPLSDWNGRYLQTGCGGYCGIVAADKPGQSNAINYALKRNYATITTDGGHQSAHIGVSDWALNNREAEEVYAYKTIPLTFEAGQALIQNLYGQRPDFNYFSGCSNGGRLAAIAAQRYPALFDGIIAGCPILNLSKNAGLYGTNIVQSNPKQGQERILGASFKVKLSFLEKEILGQCDGIDGKNDGIISQPFDCKPNIEKIQSCSDGGDANLCLTIAEKSTIENFYRGAVNSDGDKLFYGMPPGSERYWAFWFLDTEKGAAPGNLLATGYVQNLGLESDPTALSAANFNFDTDPAKLVGLAPLYNALDPDLSAFRDAGGKMIMWHGMADPLVLPQQSPEYYENVIESMGGLESSQAFVRLFMAPGIGHCWELTAPTPDHMDLLTALENWVEKDTAPEAIEVTQFHPESKRITRRGRLRPYPLQAEYGQVIP
ncbi:MAG: tannase/feruloyl esterase family alpha/beta hydrolase [Alphaproteobacteria bacterium]